jgi:uncharacterized protein
LKFLLLVLGLAVAYWIFKAYKRKVSRGSQRSTRASGGAEDMVRCAQCGVNMPRSESLMSGQAFYCTPEHRRLHEKTD